MSAVKSESRDSRHTMRRNRKAPNQMPSFDLMSESDDDQAVKELATKSSKTPESIRSRKPLTQPEQKISISLSFEVNQDEYEQKSVKVSSDDSCSAKYEDAEVETKPEINHDVFDQDSQRNKASESTDEIQTLAFLPDNLRESLMPFQREASFF
jgi:hypothetical protein